MKLYIPESYRTSAEAKNFAVLSSAENELESVKTIGKWTFPVKTCYSAIWTTAALQSGVPPFLFEPASMVSVLGAASGHKETEMY